MSDPSADVKNGNGLRSIRPNRSVKEIQLDSIRYIISAELNNSSTPVPERLSQLCSALQSMTSIDELRNSIWLADAVQTLKFIENRTSERLIALEESNVDDIDDALYDLYEDCKRHALSLGKKNE